MTTNLNDLTTPDEFINHYFNELKNDLNTQNIQLSKVGFAGFMLNLLGNTQFDTKGYYDNLFKEAFPITAQNDKNLGYHSDVFGYIPALATYAKITGVFEFNLDVLPVMLQNIAKREIIIKDTTLGIESLTYTLDADYSIILKKSGNLVVGHTELKTLEGKQKVIPFQVTDPSVQVYDLNQYIKDKVSYVATDYVFGTHYSFDIDIDSTDFVTKIDILIDGEEFELSRNKSFTGPENKVVFYEITVDNKLILELGSGLHGVYTPGAKVEVTIYRSKGALGNIGSQRSDFFKGKLLIIDYDSDGNVISTLTNPISLKDFLVVDIDRGVRGEDPLKGVNLRDALIKFIQSRNNFVSETDFRYILSNYFQDFEILFKKMKISENIFYVYQFIKDRYQNPVYTVSESVLETEFKSTEVDNSVYYPEFEIQGEAFISPFLYIYDSLLNVYNGFIVKKNPTFYSTGTVNVDPDDFEIPPLVFIQLEYNVNSTTIYVKSYQDIEDFKFTLNIPTLELNNIILTPSIEENTLEYVYPGIIKDIVDITIDVYDILDVHRFSVLFEEVRQVVDISEILRLKTFRKKDGLLYFVNLMLIHKDTYLDDEEYFLDKIIGVLEEIDLDENRMMNDDIQIRFLNTYFVNMDYLRKITLQEHNISSPELTELTVRADVDGDLDGTYFETDSIDNQFYFWFAVDGKTNIDPRPDLDDDFSAKKEEVRIDIVANSDINVIRGAVVDAFNGVQDREIFRAYTRTSDCEGGDPYPDGVFGLDTVAGGVVKNVRDPDPTSNNPYLPTGFSFEVITEGIDVGVRLPLRLRIEIAADKTLIISNNISLSVELDNIKLEIAKFLFEKKTKIYQRFYSSEIIDILHNHIWVKGAKAWIESADGLTIPDSAIEIFDYAKIERDLSKEELLDYTPVLWWWSLNDLEITYTI